MVSSAVNRSIIKAKANKPRRRSRRRNLSDDMGKAGEQLLKAAVGGGAALVVFKKIKPTANAKTNAIIHTAIAAGVGIMGLKKGQAALATGYVAGIAVLVLGQFVPQLAEGTMADYMSWAQPTLGDNPQTILDPYSNRALLYGDGTNGVGMYYADNLEFAPYEVQAHFGVYE
jgi:hypothetical protein